VAVLPEQEYLRKILDYEPETGALTWKRRDDVSAPWNTKYAGKAALAALNSDGYLAGCINNVCYRAHRVIWKWYHGADPLQIDHINGVRDDNRIVNLRNVTRAENMRNAKLSSANTSGATGVCWDKRCNKWQAHIMVNGNHHNIGVFTDFNEAVAARKLAELKHGFHPNHGRRTHLGPFLKGEG